MKKEITINTFLRLTKNRILWLLLLGISFMALISSCHKGSSSPTPINASLKEYFSYKVGTYWIYQDSLTGVIDSYYVNLVDSGTTDFYFTYNYEKWGNFKYYNANFTNTDSPIFNGYYDIIENDVDFSSFNSYYSPLFQFPYSPDSTVYSTYYVNGAVYNNVLEIHQWGTETFFISTDVGIIKMYHYLNDTTQQHPLILIRYKIVR